MKGKFPKIKTLLLENISEISSMEIGQLIMPQTRVHIISIPKLIIQVDYLSSG